MHPNRSPLFAMSSMLLGTLLLFVVPAQESSACSCVPPIPPQEALQRADLVYHGTVLSTKQLDTFQLEITFEVQSVWKGPIAAILEVQTASDSAACGVVFVQGTDYIVYGFEFEGQFSTNSCTRTRPFSREEATALGEPIWTSEDAARFKRGDLDQDGQLNLADVLAALQYLFARGREPDCLKSIDADDNGSLSIGDAIAMLLSLFGNERRPLPPPFGSCGLDPTPDGLGCRSFRCPPD